MKSKYLYGDFSKTIESIMYFALMENKKNT